MTASVVIEVAPAPRGGADVPMKWEALCPVCPSRAVRSKREAAIHVMSQHVVYEHGLEVKKP